MKFISEIIKKIKDFFSRKKVKLLNEVNSSINTENDILKDNKEFFSGFKISQEVLELALQYEKKKKLIEEKKRELSMINDEIKYLESAK